MLFSATLIFFILVGLVFSARVLKRREKEEAKPDYHTSFVLGIVWFPTGIALISLSLAVGIPFIAIGILLFAMGITFLIIGLANKDKWKETQPLPDGRRKYLIGLVVVVGVLLFSTMLGLLLASFYIKFFE